MRRSIHWISLCLALPSAAAPVFGAETAGGSALAPRPPVAAEIPGNDYRLGPEDVLVIRVARHEEMGAEVTVLNDGTIMFPRVGELQVTDRTPREVQQMIVAGLKKVLVDPQVSVLVRGPRPRRVFVSGAVRQARPVAIQPGWRVTEAIAEAGGLLAKPDRTRATLFRRPNQTIRLDLAQIYLMQDAAANLTLEPGDNIDIQEEQTTRVYVSGAVGKAGPVELPKGGGLTEAIALAGGMTPQAAASRTTVQRLSGERQQVDMDRVLNHGQSAPPVVIQHGDQIIVPENRERVAVLGFVKNPGPFPLRDGVAMTVPEAVALAGGTIKRAQPSKVGVIRIVDGQRTVLPVNLGRALKKGSREENPTLQDGDIVYVPETDRPDWSKILPGVQSLGSLWYLLTR